MLKNFFFYEKLFYRSILFIFVFYNFSFFFPFTNNAFVVANIRPVAANVSGYITQIYVKNEQYVKKGQPLFQVFQTPYVLAYQKAQHDIVQATEKLKANEQGLIKINHLIAAEEQLFQQYHYDYIHYQQALHDHAVSKIEVNTFMRKQEASLFKLKALKAEKQMRVHEIAQQKAHIQSLIRICENAKVNLDETVVYAKSNGFIQNLFTSIGAPIEIRQPLFAFVDTEHFYIQANFSEIDLRYLKAGRKVTIIPRVYFGSKVYHGVIVSNHWATSRQTTDSRTQEQIVTNSENNWLLLPQRFPVQIEITDYDAEHYPLSVGSSAYVYVNVFS